MFITFEGTEGCGKTTQQVALVEYLINAGYDVLTTREPGGTPIGDQIRAVLLDPKNSTIHQRTEILLFQASRAQLVEQVIRPQLQRGGVVVCDRYADSTIAYQGYGYQLDLALLRSLVHFATGGLVPDLTLLLDLEVEEGLRRRTNKGEINRLDAYALEFYQRVRTGYHEMARAEPGRWVIIAANQPPDLVKAAIRQVVLRRLSDKK